MILNVKEMRRDLEQYLGKLGTMIVDASIKFAVNYTYQVFSMGPGANALGWDQKKFENIPAPSIDSETGRIDAIAPEKIVHEVLEHSCYLMQTIKIGSSEALVFFDRGANIHIIDGYSHIIRKMVFYLAAQTDFSISMIKLNNAKVN